MKGAYKTKGGWWAEPVYFNPITGDSLVIHHEPNGPVAAVWTNENGAANRDTFQAILTDDFDRECTCQA